MSDARLTGAPAPAGGPNLVWERALVWFMRAMAIVWIAKGLSNWLVILGHDPMGGPSFSALPVPARTAVIIFAVLDLVAAVGLWLTSTWGGVMWLLAILSHLLMGVLAPSGQFSATAFAGFELMAIAVYVCLSWLASREG